MMVDLQEIRMEARQLFYVLPGQVHDHIRAHCAEGWFMGVDRSLVPQGCRNILEGRLTLQTPCSLTPAALEECVQLLRLLVKRSTDKTRLYAPVAHSLAQSFLWLAADAYDDSTSPHKTLSRPAELCRQFRLLLSENIRTIKTPSAYASSLHVSTSYLNEAIRGETGLPCSHWIKQEVLMEAKRLLYHSELSVKEIAEDLGYEDPAYFSRFFRKAAGMPAIAFREVSRK
nr:helix-turn-helix domain-containing protein [Dinghuibacter silviterrae]